MHWFAQAPSNIALIKYMGKKDVKKNIPANPSLSYTLGKLLTSVELESTLMKKDHWEPLVTPGTLGFNLNQAGQTRFLNHLSTIKNHFNYEGHFIVRSANNFPHSSGLASSASSFAALTKCAILALTELTEQAIPAIDVQIDLSRQGSGSSCRSFYSPWVLWNEKSVQPIDDIPYTNLIHQVILISHAEKDVSSSKAHQLITSSPHYANRVQRAKLNLNQLLDAFRQKDWPHAFDICWREFHDMHNLFTTAQPAFSYMTPQSEELLEQLKHYWESYGDGPLVTMDAGPNIHLLYRADQQEHALRFKRDHLIGNYDVL